MEDHKESKNNIKNILISIFIFIFILLLFIPLSNHGHSSAYTKRMVCLSNLHMLTISFYIYQEENSQYPVPDQWCDKIQYFEEGVHNYFLCPLDEVGPCSYAMNENIPADATELPDDLVILFESAPGWNQVGGPDDVVTDRHKNPGANIAFADGTVEFIEAEDIPNLRWTVVE